LLKTLETEKERRLTTNRFTYYKPYPKQLGFHMAGASHRERLLMAANQVGKTFAAAMELAAHVTEQYPSWWRYVLTNALQRKCPLSTTHLTGNPEVSHCLSPDLYRSANDVPPSR
jgi:hypothetical protein